MPGSHDLYRTIESVASVLDSFVSDLAMKTGWAFSVIGGGPDPVNGGRIQTIRLAPCFPIYRINTNHIPLAFMKVEISLGRRSRKLMRHSMRAS